MICKPYALGILLGTNPYIEVHLDPRRDGVIVPAKLRDQPSTMLHIGTGMRRPMTNFDVTADHFECTLSFGGVPAHVTIPFSAVYLMRGTEVGYIWHEDAPKDLAVIARGTELAENAKIINLAERRAKLRTVH